MRQRLTRRQLLRLVLGLGGAAMIPVLEEPVAVAARENCYWRRVYGPTCSSGQMIERWCFMCCAGTSCWTEWCEWRAVGSC